jgi:hypothetical protein
MTASAGTIDTRTMAVAHRTLSIGLLVVAVIVGWLASKGTLPLLPPSPWRPVIGYILGAVGLVVLGVGVFVLKPRVPGRTPGQRPDEFWGTPGTGARALAVWATLEGGALTSGMGFACSGELTAALVACAAIVSLFLFDPATLAREQF